MRSIDFQAVESIIRDVAATEIMPRFRNLQADDIAFKIGDDPVTVADKAAEKALSERLRKLLPGSVIVGEEECFLNPAVLDQFQDEAPIWIIDPIDGTKNFTDGVPVFGVVVALVQHHKTLAGWLYDPNSDEFITAEHGAGAWHKGRRLSVLPPEPLERLTGPMGPSLRQAYAQASIPPGTVEPVFDAGFHMGACHTYARLVAGPEHFSRPASQWHFRCVMNAGMPWDDAAALLVHSEAGGYSALFNGDPVPPSVYRQGLIAAPDKDCWHALRGWLGHFCQVGELRREAMSA